jgi:hypothetical protein
MDEDENSAARRMAELDTANITEMKAKLAAAASLAYLADEAARAAKGLASIGNPNGIYNYTPSSPSFTYSSPIADGMSNMPEAGSPQGIYDYSPTSPSFTYGAGNPNYNIVINTPLGSEEYLTEAMQRALQKLNRYGDSTTFAGAL